MAKEIKLIKEDDGTYTLIPNSRFDANDIAAFVVMLIVSHGDGAIHRIESKEEEHEESQ